MKRSVVWMIVMITAVLLALLISNDGVPAQELEQPAPSIIVVRAYYTDKGMVNDAAMWTEPWEVNDDEGYIVLDATPAEIKRLEAMGFRVEVDKALTAQYAAPRTKSPDQASGIPGYACYRTVEETFATAETIAADYPDLATWTDVGDSWEKMTAGGNAGYDMMVLKLTNSAIPGPKPKLFIMTSVHAREYTPAELNTRFAEYLVANYGVDADVTWMLDYNEIHLMLQANPDGRKHAEAGQSWRKNTNENYCGTTSISRGADLNRNYPFHWGGPGAGTDPCDNTYRGASAASEPETQAVTTYVRANYADLRPDDVNVAAPITTTGIFLDIHSYSELVLWSWGDTSNLPPNHTGLQTLGRKFAYFNGYEPDQSVGLYPTSGTTDDFAYGELGLPAYTFELGTSFFQNCTTFENTILPDNLEALIYAAKVTRRPYMTPAGPDALNLQLSDLIVTKGAAVTLTTTLNDTHYNNQNGTEPTQNISAGQHSIDTPIWEDGVTVVGLTAVDGNFNSSVEDAYSVIDTTSLTSGRHMVYVRGQDAAGNWGAVSAAFLYVIDPAVSPTLDGTVVDGNTGLPMTAAINTDSVFQTTTDGSGLYQMQVISGTYELTAIPTNTDYAAEKVNITASDNQTVTHQFQLYPRPLITGTITAVDTRQPVTATITTDSGYQTTTDAQGRYEIRVISGTQEITAVPNVSTYGAKTVTVSVNNNQTVMQNIQLYPFCEVFSDDIEGGTNGWTSDSPWAITTANSHSPTHSWRDSVGDYGNYQNISLTSPTFDLTEYGDIRINYWQQCNTEEDYDYCILETSTDGTDWREIARWDGLGNSWEEVTYATANLNGQEYAQVRFRLSTDQTVTEDGWYVDDINIIGAGESCIQIMVPTADFTSTTPDALGTATAFTDNSIGGELNHQWDFGDGNISATANPTHTYAAVGTYTITLQVTNTLGIDVYTDTVDIMVGATAVFTSTTPDALGATTVFTNNSTGDDLNYQWDFGDGNVSVTTNPTHTYAAIGTYIVTLQAANAAGANIYTDTVDIITMPTAVFTTTTPDALGTATVFTNNSTGGGLNHQWDFGDGNISATANPTHTYAAVGTYTVTLQVTNTLGIDVYTDTVDIMIGATAVFTSTTPDALGTATVFTNNSTGDGLNYQWDFGDGNVSVTTNPTHTYAAVGTYTVTLQVTNTLGVDTYTDTVDIMVSPTAVFTATTTTTIGTPITFTNQSLGNALTYLWSFGDGITSTLTSPSYLYDTSGTYTVTLTAVNAIGTDMDTQQVTILPHYLYLPMLMKP